MSNRALGPTAGMPQPDAYAARLAEEELGLKANANEVRNVISTLGNLGYLVAEVISGERELRGYYEFGALRVGI